MKGDGWRVPGCDLSLLKTINLLHLGLNDCSNVTDERILKGLTGCNESVCEDISGYIMIRDAGVSALGAKCGQLQSINLECCSKVTDASIAAFGSIIVGMLIGYTRWWEDAKKINYNSKYLLFE